LANLPRAFERAPHDHNAVSVKDYKILRRQAYGKLIRLRDADTAVERTIRVAWGARSWPDLNVYSRNAPVIDLLISLDKGEFTELMHKGKLREYEVTELTIPERHAQNRLMGNYDNFALLEHDLDQDRQREAPRALDLSSRAALGDRFFMQPLRAQEQVMRWPAEGHVLVEGVAGSGMTSVALGRAAMLCMQRDDGGRPGPFSAETGIGFVLSEQLVGYLEQLRSGALNLEKMPVKSYFRLRQELLIRRNLLSEGFRREAADREEMDQTLGTAAWAEAAEEIMAPRVRDALRTEIPDDARAVLGTFSGINEDHWKAIRRPWQELVEGMPAVLGGAQSNTLGGSLERLDRVRASFADTLERLPAERGFYANHGSSICPGRV
jgi:hypothetical protein